MKDQLLGFFDALRQAGVATTLSETLDAVHAVRAAGIERPVLREALAASLVKDHADRAAFDAVFDRYFAVAVVSGAKRRPEPREGEGAGRMGAAAGGGQQPEEGTQGRRVRESPPPRPAPSETPRQAARLGQRKALAAKPFREMDALEVEALDELVAELGRRLRARFARRLRRATRGRLDLRRTIRRALPRGGVPLELVWRAPRPGKSDLVALVDLSYSTATAAEFLLALLAPARRYFRRVTLLAYVDRPCPVSIEGGHVVPHEPFDLNARSDFGAVLRGLGERFDVTLRRNTVLLVLGDARNNRRPPRADLLARLRRTVKRVVWLNPEPPARWNTGDSVMQSYAPHVDALLAAGTPRQLAAALGELAKLAL
ncbi:MAG: VWA domain-containing protein [Deltaproteobacteria bacterium]|nr:VWA domain-containing protein [Deltaproteobacteria bacterium]